MTRLALLVKSYQNDIGYVDRLVASINAFNRDGIPTFIVIPGEDVSAFSRFKSAQINVLPESRLASHLVDESVTGLSAGYINQEIVKLAFWELGLADNYVCVDSDAEFIRDFTVADFMATADVPYTFMSEDAELRCEPDYHRTTWTPRLAKLEKVREAMRYQGPWLYTVHGHAVFSSVALESFVRDFLEPQDWDYRDALAICPYEPTWYTTWVLHARPIPLYPREPIFKTFHNSGQHLDYVLRGVTTADIARGYVGVVVNSNYSRGEGIVPVTLELYEALASYGPVSTLLRAMWYRAWDIVALTRTTRKRVRTAAGRVALRLPGLRRFVDQGICQP